MREEWESREHRQFRRHCKGRECWSARLRRSHVCARTLLPERASAAFGTYRVLPEDRGGVHSERHDWFWDRPSCIDLWHDLRAVTSEIRPDLDLSTPGLRSAWDADDFSRLHGWNERATMEGASIVLTK
jgi:hypothetical protein